MTEEALTTLEDKVGVISDRVRGVSEGYSNGFYLFGRPGTGKTYTVRRTLGNSGRKYVLHTGYLTPGGLRELLESARDEIVVLDDVRQILTQPVAVQILLAALGEQPGGGARIISYRRQGSATSFAFSGGVIFISNLSLREHEARLLDALRSRVHTLAFEPSDEEMAALARSIAQQGFGEGEDALNPEVCSEVTEFAIEESEFLGIRLDLRSVQKALSDRCLWNSGRAETHWKALVRCSLEEQASPAVGSGNVSRAARKAAEQELVEELMTQFPDSREEQIAAWKAETGKSSRAYYRRLSEIEQAA